MTNCADLSPTALSFPPPPLTASGLTATSGGSVWHLVSYEMNHVHFFQLTACNAGPLCSINGSSLAVSTRRSTPGIFIGHCFMGIRICSCKKLEYLRDKKNLSVIFLFFNVVTGEKINI